MNLGQLSWDLFTAGLRGKSGTGLLNFIAIVTLTVAATISFLVAGGTWAFYQRYLDAAPLGKEAQLDSMQMLFLALIACGFLVPALFSLIAQAAVLGASGREQRLASLRLIGLTSGQVTRMTMFETACQATFGVFVGCVVSVMLLPLFSHLSFQGKPLSTEELLLPWWGYLLVASIVMILALLASLAGMQRVRVTPLGVSKRQVPAAVKWWRLIAFIIITAFAAIVVNSSDPAASINDLLLVASAIFVIALSFSIVGPLLLQIIAKVLAFTPINSVFVASRRVSTDARLAWKRSSAMAFFGLICGTLVVSPLTKDGLTAALENETNVAGAFKDIATGSIITLGFGYCIVAFSLFLGQANEVFETARLQRSLSQLGVNRSFHFTVTLSQYLGPVVLLSFFGFFVGAGMSSLLINLGADADWPARIRFAGMLLGAGWLLAVLSMVAVEPLRSKILRSAVRAAD